MVPSECSHSDALPRKLPGKKRQIPHIAGNFNSFVYIPIRSTRFYNQVAKRCAALLEELQKLQNCYLASSAEVLDSGAKDSPVFNYVAEREENIHLSLSRPLFLRHHFIDTFIHNLHAKIMHFHRFHLSFDTANIDVYANDTYDRFFAGLCIEHAGTRHEIHSLIDAVDEVVFELGFPKYYTERQLHASFASIPQDLRPILKHLCISKNSNNSGNFLLPEKLNETHSWFRVNTLIEKYHMSERTALSPDEISIGTFNAINLHERITVLGSGNKELIKCSENFTDHDTTHNWFSVKVVNVLVGKRLSCIPLLRQPSNGQASSSSSSESEIE
ncbi:hypothetical protein IE077_003143 [Cardiosporidium cionae]|uniref:U6 snRNA phosphodiesterase 1 n=1 Tax=Cardiosporidium cionae TaxID=476202 RepID=A0ABQ7JFM0_9APIC|nr:hypothetical protein IE077_003143 [Cardiosporidium cionae]|eukprot:KAF8822674.1 hypothetical protein IE077_003143 [Cardiosporidium cionae]